MIFQLLMMKKEMKKSEENIVKIRIQDVSITYDFNYCLPRIWLIDYNEKGNPLNDEEIKEDDMPE